MKESRILKSPKSEEIMGLIKRHIGNSTYQQMYKKVQKIDPALDVPYNTFKNFVKKIEDKQKEQAVMILNKMKELPEEDLNSDQIMGKIINMLNSKLFNLSNTVIESTMYEVSQLIARGERIPDNTKRIIMEWMLKGMKLELEKRSVDINANADKRAETVFDNLFRAAQYGKTKVVDGQIIGENEYES